MFSHIIIFNMLLIITSLFFITAMFSLFICVTQDGWVDIVEELNECGSPILGPIYLVVFITVGAFILANLVVAVVVTNLVCAVI